MCLGGEKKGAESQKRGKSTGMVWVLARGWGSRGME